MGTANRINLVKQPEKTPEFVKRVADYAVGVFALERARATKTKQRPTGEDLCRQFASHWRNGHQRLASTVYSKTLWALRVTAEGK